MTKSIIELAFEAHLYDDDQEPLVQHLEAYAAAIKAAHLEELLAGVEMPEPVAWRCTNWSGSPDDYIYRDADDCAVNAKGEKCGEGLVTLDQCQQAVAAAVARKEIEFRTDLQEVVSGAEQTETKFEAELAKKNAEIAELQSKYFVAAATELEKTQALTAEFDAIAVAVGWTKERCEQSGDSPLDCAKALTAECNALREALESTALGRSVAECVEIARAALESK